MCIYVCVICVCVLCTYVCAYIYTYMCACVSTYMHLYAYMYVGIYIDTDIYVHIIWAFLVAQLEESTSNAGDSSSIPGLGRSLEEGIGYTLQ